MLRLGWWLFLTVLGAFCLGGFVVEESGWWIFYSAAATAFSVAGVVACALDVRDEAVERGGR